MQKYKVIVLVFELIWEIAFIWFKYKYFVTLYMSLLSLVILLSLLQKQTDNPKSSISASPAVVSASPNFNRWKQANLKL